MLTDKEQKKSDKVEFSEIPEILETLKRNEIIVLIDAEDRENEGDLTVAAEKVTIG